MLLTTYISNSILFIYKIECFRYCFSLISQSLFRVCDTFFPFATLQVHFFVEKDKRILLPNLQGSKPNKM